MDNMNTTGTDFIATELLRELKTENARKDTQVKRLQLALISVMLAAIIGVLAVVGCFIWYLNQYDFSGSSSVTTDYSTVKQAEGVFAVIDSYGNVVGQDVPPEQLDALMEGVKNGESTTSKSSTDSVS